MFFFKLSRLQPALQLLDTRSRWFCGLLALSASLVTLSATLSLSATSSQAQHPLGLRAEACKPLDAVQAESQCRCAQPLAAVRSCA